MSEVLSKAIERLRATPAYAEESLRGEISEAINEAMLITGTSRAQLARRLNVSRAHVTQMLQGNNNFEVATLARIAFALGVEWKITIAQKGK